jgi:hypothetical protein
MNAIIPSNPQIKKNDKTITSVDADGFNAG